MSDENIRKEIIRNSVHSTKKWLYHYLLDHMYESDRIYPMALKCVEDVYKFQNEILEQIEENPQQIVGECGEFHSIENVRRKQIVEKIIKQIESEVDWAKYAGMPFDLTIEKILRIIRGDL